MIKSKDIGKVQVVLFNNEGKTVAEILCTDATDALQVLQMLLGLTEEK